MALNIGGRQRVCKQKRKGREGLVGPVTGLERERGKADDLRGTTAKFSAGPPGKVQA